MTNCGFLIVFGESAAPDREFYMGEAVTVAARLFVFAATVEVAEFSRFYYGVSRKSLGNIIQ